MSRDSKLKRYTEQIEQDVSSDYATKPSGTTGNFVSIAASGDLADSSYTATDFADADANTTDAIVSTTTVSNTTTETTIWTGPIPADTLSAGAVLKVFTSGVISNNSASDDISIKSYIGATLITSYAPAIGNVIDADWHLDQLMTIRSIGATGSVAVHGLSNIDGSEEYNNSIETVDTTVAEDITVTVTWVNAKVDNIISIYQGILETNK